MRIRILGAGFYGCHIADALLKEGHEVQVHEIADRIFAGASGGIPARLHLGFHYPRSRMTRAACLEHYSAFMGRYGFLTRAVPVNLYAIARDHSLVDFDQYVSTLKGEVEFVRVDDPGEFGLRNVEGAVLTGERHIVTDLAREHFEGVLDGAVMYGIRPDESPEDEWDWTIDCTFCANSSSGVDRYEPCLVLLLEGPTDKAVTVMDGPFGSVYPWNEDKGLVSLSSAKWTPYSKECRTWQEARDMLGGETEKLLRGRYMIDAMAEHYPAIRDYRIAGYRHSVRAMPLSGADTRLVDVVQQGPRLLRVRAGKIDAIIHAESIIREMIH